MGEIMKDSNDALVVKSNKNKSITGEQSLQELSKADAKLRDKEESIRLWNKYDSQKRPLHIREQLIKRYAYIVNWVIGRFPHIETADFDREDLLGYGTIGLIEAIDRFDPQQKCSFETFAINRVRGEILDFLRSRDFLSRTGRSRVKKFNEAITTLEKKLGRQPTDAEIKSVMEVDSEDLRTMRREANAIVFSLDSTEATRPFEDAKISLLDNLADNSESQEDYTERQLLKEKLKKAIGSLGQRDRLVVALYHYQKLTFREIGEVLGVSESRASQLHMKVLQKLRVLMKGYEV
jgi:RNA polymerase sigma factor FliA